MNMGKVSFERRDLMMPLILAWKFPSWVGISSDHVDHTASDYALRCHSGSIPMSPGGTCWGTEVGGLYPENQMARG